MWGGGNHLRKFPQRKRTASGGFYGGLSELFADDSAARTPTARSPRSFDGGGTVGLGIVAAMSGPVSRVPPARSEPISIGSARVAAEASRSDPTEEEELSESYTCVIWHLGGSLAGKRVYFDDGKAASSEPRGRGLHEQLHSGFMMSSSWVG